MKQSHIIVLIILGLILTISACQKDEVILEREYPRLNISENIEMSEAGAVFEAGFLTQNVDIIDKGFVWGDGGFSRVEKESHISLGGGNETGTFSTMSSFDLVKGKEYFVHAYARTTEHLVYSKAIKFISTTNGPGQTLDSFYPGRGSVNDTVVISGSDLSYHAERIRVVFGNVKAAIQSSTDTTISVTVPELKSSKALISVTINGTEEKFEDLFILDVK